MKLCYIIILSKSLSFAAFHSARPAKCRGQQRRQGQGRRRGGQVRPHPAHAAAVRPGGGRGGQAATQKEGTDRDGALICPSSALRRWTGDRQIDRQTADPSCKSPKATLEKESLERACLASHFPLMNRGFLQTGGWIVVGFHPRRSRCCPCCLRI